MPPHGSIYSMSPLEWETLRKYVEENLNKGFIHHSQSPCSAPILFVKKSDGTLQLCVDSRGLNKITTKNPYPLPLIGEMLDRISRAKFFTKMDVRDGYNCLCMAIGEEWKTTFQCRYGHFKYIVMPFSLCNAPGTFQHYMNDTFCDFLNQFLIDYLDDLLIYLDTLAEHKRHVRMVLERLKEAELCLKPSKCQFHLQEVSFLGFIVGPMTALLKKNNKFQWTAGAQETFEQLRSAFTSPPSSTISTLHYQSSWKLMLRTMLSLRSSPRGTLRTEYSIPSPSTVASSIRRNSTMRFTTRKCLAIVETMDHYHHYFEGLGHQAIIFSDHRNLLWFTETKVYNRRQARWAEKLSHFDFKIIFHPGKQGWKPDALSCHPDYTLGNDAEAGTMTFLKLNQVDASLLDDSEIPQPNCVSSATTSVNIGTNHACATASCITLESSEEICPCLPYLRNPNLLRSDAVAKSLRLFTLDKSGLVLQEGLVYVPAVEAIKVEVLRECHDAKFSRHLGRDKTLELVSRNYYWPGMSRLVREFVQTCDICARNKISRHSLYGELCPLPIPAGPWQSVSMDFIMDLPPSSGYNAIYVCIDCLTKMAHLIPTTTEVMGEETAHLYCHDIWRLHGLPVNIVSDHGMQFISKFTRRLLDQFDIEGN
jgi:hypothetical protein